MKWTDKPPQEDGWYWLKANHFYPQCVWFEMFATGPRISVCGTDVYCYLHDFSNAQWAGPIPEPDE